MSLLFFFFFGTEMPFCLCCRMSYPWVVRVLFMEYQKWFKSLTANAKRSFFSTNCGTERALWQIYRGFLFLGFFFCYCSSSTLEEWRMAIQRCSKISDICMQSAALSVSYTFSTLTQISTLAAQMLVKRGRYHHTEINFFKNTYRLVQSAASQRQIIIIWGIYLS